MEIAVISRLSHHTPADFIAGAAKRIEDAGFATLWVPEHVLFFPDYESSYPYSDDGKVPGNPDGVLDPFAALTFVAAHTSTLRLGTGICIVPQRQPVYTAKMVADLDFLSGGRVDFGIGVGWLEEEFDALGMDFSARGARCNEYVDAMKALWGPDPVSFHGETVNVNNAQANPKPTQTPHPPIFVGGESKPALRRVATHGDGWFGFGLAPDDVAEHVTKLEAHLATAGRDRSDIKICISPNQHRVDPDVTAAYAEAGVDQLIVGLFGHDLDELDGRIGGIQRKTGMA